MFGVVYKPPIMHDMYMCTSVEYKIIGKLSLEQDNHLRESHLSPSHPVGQMHRLLTHWPPFWQLGVQVACVGSVYIITIMLQVLSLIGSMPSPLMHMEN